MKHLLPVRFIILLCVGILCVTPFTSTIAQNNHVHGTDPIYGDSLDGFDPNKIMQKANQKGLQPYEAALYMGKCKREYIDRKYNLKQQNASSTTASTKLTPLSSQVMPPCTNMNFEAGNFNGWTGSIGDNSLNSNGPLQNIVPGIFSTTMDAALTDCSARHTIMSAAGGNEPCGGFPVVAPGGNFSVRLGQTCANYQGEILEQTFTVSTTTTAFTYQYAVVLNDGGHSAGEQPYFKIEMFDQSGNLIPCSQYFVEASGVIPGFVQCVTGTYYKPWTTVNVDLQGYVGQNVTIRFTAAGCIYAGHYGYAYVDASCLPYAIALSDSLCAGSSITLTAPAGAQSYQWSTGATSQTITVSSPGTYTVNMISVTNCPTVLSVNVGQYPNPVASFNATVPPCQANYTFTNTSTISSGSMTYHWDFGDPTLTNDTSNLTSPTFTYPNPGNYTVTLIATSASGCSDTVTFVVNAGNGGQASFHATTECLNNPTSFTDQSTGASAWSWNFGEPSSGPNDSSNVQNPTHTYASPGTYTVTLTAQTNPCPSTFTTTITVNPLPLAAFSFTQSCVNNDVTFTNNSSIANPDQITGYSWNFGDPASGGNNISTSASPTHTFSGPGTYTVILTVTSNNNCQSTISQVVNVGVTPNAAFTAASVCTNTPMQFTNNSLNANTYFWNFGDPAVNTDTTSSMSPTYTYTNAGNYTVMLIANPGSGCPDTTTLLVNVAPGPAVLFAAPTVCESFTTTFTDQSTITTGNITNWSWDFGVGSMTSDTSNVQSPTFVYPTSGSYTVTLTCTSSNGCSTTYTQVVTVNPLPTANFTAATVCIGNPTTFTDLSASVSGNVTNWVWDFGDGSPFGNTQNPTHTYANDTTYNVTLIVQNANGCIDTVTLPVVTAPQPVVEFVGDSLMGCPTHCVNFTDMSTISTGSITGWMWDFGDGSPTAFTQNPNHCFSQPGTYDVTLSVTSGNGCVQSLTLPSYITVYPVPNASFNATPQITTVLQTNINFTDLSGGNPIVWSWNFGDGSVTNDTSNLQNPAYTYSNEYGSIYSVTLTVTNQYGCTDDTTLNVEITPDWAFYIPNTFTPNGDGNNDFFFGQGFGITSYEIWIFDRWGNMIFTTTDINKGWDGTVQGKSGQICQIDTYVWKVVLTDVFNKRHKYIGHVNLIR